MEGKELKVKTEQLLNRYKELWEKVKRIQETAGKTKTELKEIVDETRKNPILSGTLFKDFAFFFGYLGADLDRLRDLKSYIEPEEIDTGLALLAKNQNLICNSVKNHEREVKGGSKNECK